MTIKKFNQRQLQIGENIRRLVAREVNELANGEKPKNDFLTIMKAEISKDLRYCKVFYRCKTENREFFQKCLDANANELDNIIYKQLHLRIRPDLKFVFDDTMKIIEEIEEVIERNKEFVE